MDDHYALLAMRDYRVRANGPELEKLFWDVFPSRQVRYWPLFLNKARDAGAFLEKTRPVRVETRVTGWGAFVTEVRPLSPWMAVQWKRQLWYVSREGRMWNAASEMTPPTPFPRPLWRVSANFDKQNQSALPKGVFPSVFPMESIEGFLKDFGGAPWFGGVREVDLDRRAGSDLFKLRFVRGEQEFMILIQKDKYEWRELETALEGILDSLYREGVKRLLIDATYRGKIVLRELSSAAGEGG
ncbi:MAG: hypothetical protein LBD04_11935 [Synergistaceae bacterium]|nr:hypothetical protein [Synergistaceae bacterium]